MQDNGQTKIYPESNLNLLTTIASQAAIAVQNIHLLNDTQTQAKAMRRLYDLGVPINRESEINQTIKLILTEDVTLSEATSGVIFIRNEEEADYIVEQQGQLPKDSVLTASEIISASLMAL